MPKRQKSSNSPLTFFFLRKYFFRTQNLVFLNNSCKKEGWKVVKLDVPFFIFSMNFVRYNRHRKMEKSHSFFLLLRSIKSNINKDKYKKSQLPEKTGLCRLELFLVALAIKEKSENTDVHAGLFFPTKKFSATVFLNSFATFCLLFFWRLL